MGQTAVSDNQSSSVTLNELAKKARKIYYNFEFQRRSHTMTEINLNRAQITKTVSLYLKGVNKQGQISKNNAFLTGSVVNST